MWIQIARRDADVYRKTTKRSDRRSRALRSKTRHSCVTFRVSAQPGSDLLTEIDKRDGTDYEPELEDKRPL